MPVAPDPYAAEDEAEDERQRRQLTAPRRQQATDEAGGGLTTTEVGGQRVVRQPSRMTDAAPAVPEAQPPAGRAVSDIPASPSPFAEPPPVRFGKPNSPELAQEWDGFLSNPDNQAAMIQFGIALMQPMGLGQNPIGHVGSAIGQTGEMFSRREAAALKERTQSSREEIAAERSDIARERLENERARREAGTAQKGVSRTAIFSRMEKIRDRLEKALDAEAENADKAANKEYGMPADPRYKKYQGLTRPAIRAHPELRKDVESRILTDEDRRVLELAKRIEAEDMGTAAPTAPAAPAGQQQRQQRAPAPLPPQNQLIRGQSYPLTPPPPHKPGMYVWNGKGFEGPVDESE